MELGEGLAGVDRVELLLVADQHDAGNAQRIGDTQQVAGEHRGLAGPGIALDTHRAVLGGEDQSDRLPLAVGERAVAQRLVDGAPAHRRRAPSLAGPHQRDGLALVADGTLSAVLGC